jgi:DNA repair protein SbcD/Mre11
MIRFVHAADLHLDSPLCGLDETAPAERIRSAPRQALRNLIDFCLECQADFLLLAGDCYDGDCKDGATGTFLASELRRLGNMPVLMIQGNHDAQSVITNYLPMPGNVRQFKDRPQTENLESVNVAVHGASFAKRSVVENLARNYPKAVPGAFNIGLLHTSLSQSGEHETYSPCTAEQLQQHNYDYWALGHIHSRQVVRERDPAIVFPGNLQGRRARESGPKGAILVEVNDERVIERLQFHALDEIRWERIEMAVDPAASADDVLLAVAARVIPLRESAGNRLLALRAVLSGPSAAHNEFQSRPQYWRERLAEHVKNCVDDAWLEDVNFRTAPPEADIVGDWGDVDFELTESLLAFQENPALLQKLIDGPMQELADKLPRELHDGPEPLNMQDPAWLSDLLSRVLPTLRQSQGARK